MAVHRGNPGERGTTDGILSSIGGYVKKDNDERDFQEYMTINSDKD
jgi:hypothetical protein